MEASKKTYYLDCANCSETFESCDERDQHCKVAGHEKPTIRCIACNRLFVHQRTLDNHNNNVHHGRTTARSAIVALAGTSGAHAGTKNLLPQLAMAIMAPHHRGDQFRCGVCDKTFKGREGRDKHCTAIGHAKPDLEPGENQSQAAGTQTISVSATVPPAVSSLAEVATEKHPAQLTVSTQPIAPSLPETPAVIYELDTSGRLWCLDCGRSFVSQGALDEHDRAVHTRSHPGPSTGPFECRDCGRGFQSRKVRSKHILNSSECGIACPHCLKRLALPSLLCQHLEIDLCKAESASHLGYAGMHIQTRLMDPDELMTLDVPDWNWNNLIGNSRPFFYHCPSKGKCNRKFRTLVGVMTHMECGSCGGVDWSTIKKTALQIAKADGFLEF